MPRTKVEFEGHDGERLAGLLEYPDDNATAWALFAHCFSCGKDIAAASRIARALVARGMAVLRFDFTGLGNSDGDFANTNFSSNVADLLKAAAFLKSEYRAPALLIGHSLGGTAALVAAHEIPECKGVVTIGAPSEPAHITKHFGSKLETIQSEGEAEVDIGGRSLTIKQQFIDDVARVEKEKLVRNLRKALLIFHSPLDEVVAIEEAEKIYRAARHPKSFVSLDQADHLLRDKADAEYVAAVISAWATRFIGDVDQVQPSEGKIETGAVVVGERNHQFTRTVHTDSHSWFADEPTAAGGHDLGPDPYEHLLAALGTCTSMTIRMYANHKSLPLDDVEVTLTHNRRYVEDCRECEEEGEEGHKIDVIDRKISFKGDLNDETRARLLEIADKCPVHRTLTSEIRVVTELAE